MRKCGGQDFGKLLHADIFVFLSKKRYANACELFAAVRIRYEVDSVESINDALIQAVKDAGGSKVVGPRLWPELLSEAAQRKLLDCLNPERPHKLSPEQAMFILRLSKDAGKHDAMAALAGFCGYSAPAPIAASDEAAELRRRVLEMGSQMADLVAALNRFSGDAK
ncbi:MAG: phage regulatory CII family protein [Burkholderiaceae bacterium]